jgi:excisionase family DNA binding protein
VATDNPALNLALPPTLIEAIAQRAADLVLHQLETARDQTSPYLTIPEAATYARCKRQRIDDLLSARRLTRYKDGRRTLVLRAELEAHLVTTTGPGHPSRPSPSNPPLLGPPGGDSISAANRATVTNPGNKTPR